LKFGTPEYAHADKTRQPNAQATEQGSKLSRNANGAKYECAATASVSTTDL